MGRGKLVKASSNGTGLSADETRLLQALARVPLLQPRTLTRRHGIVNLFWLAIEELGARRGPRALDGLVEHGYMRRDPRHPEIGRITPAGTRALASARSTAA